MRNLEICYRTIRGKRRELNEDSLLAVTIGDVDILAIADGLGGHAAGEIASRLATGELEESLRSNLSINNLQDSVRAALFRANAEIYLLSHSNPCCGGLASTMVAAAVSQNDALIANVGDSRAYLVGTKIRRITKDHSLMQQLIDKSLISEEESFDHSQKNVITMSLGRRSEIDPDFYQIELSEEILLLCSDGLNDSLRDEQIGKIIRESASLKDACGRLLEVAEANGASDDISIVLGRKN
jgi:serine/threonine protein phosphatase PrpC